MNKFNKEELEDLIHSQNKTYREIGRIFNVSDTYIKKIAKKEGININKLINILKKGE